MLSRDGASPIYLEENDMTVTAGCVKRLKPVLGSHEVAALTPHCTRQPISEDWRPTLRQSTLEFSSLLIECDLPVTTASILKQLIKFAKFNLLVGINCNGVAVVNKGPEYSEEKPGSVYIVPVKRTISPKQNLNQAIRLITRRQRRLAL